MMSFVYHLSSQEDDRTSEISDLSSSSEETLVDDSERNSIPILSAVLELSHAFGLRGLLDEVTQDLLAHPNFTKADKYRLSNIVPSWLMPSLRALVTQDVRSWHPDAMDAVGGSVQSKIIRLQAFIFSGRRDYCLSHTPLTTCNTCGFGWQVAWRRFACSLS